MKSDHQLKQDVIDELAWEPSVNETEVGVQVKEGIVTLTGHLDSYAEKWAAERAAQRVSGVKGVALELDVRLPGDSKRSDTDIARSTQHVLAWNTSVPKDRITVIVEGGWIKLSGSVEQGYQRMAAENALRHLMGVRGINNQIIIKSSAMPENIKQKIEAALQRRAHIETEAINVTVVGDEVTLTGTVLSLSEKQAACAAAASAPGVAHVVDKMRVA